jgi:hypothetical protein
VYAEAIHLLIGNIGGGIDHDSNPPAPLMMGQLLLPTHVIGLLPAYFAKRAQHLERRCRIVDVYVNL